ncbi:FHA domain-containing protein [Persicitalea sp.]|uniref:FHA domain-containing protein n=1 Tax=Persicitalea sp. TaxID=3100273 RepID=UPI00359378AF
MSSPPAIPEIPTVTIGRDKANTVVLNHATISRTHARLIVCSPTSFILEDSDSKHGTFFADVNQRKVQLARKLVDLEDEIWLAEHKFRVEELLPDTGKSPAESRFPKKNPLDFTEEFALLRKVYDDYPQLRKDCRNREKMIRLWSVVGGSVIGIGTVATAGSLGFLAMLSSAGLSILIPTLSSHLLSTDEKLELLEKEYRQHYRCPNTICREPFGNREYEMLERQKKCHRCKAVWVE